MLEEKCADRNRVQKQIGVIRRALTRKASIQSDDIRSSQWILLENEQNQREVRQLEKEFNEMKKQLKKLEQELKKRDEEINRQDIEMKQSERILERLELGRGEFTTQQIASKLGITQQSVSKRVLALIGDGLLSGTGREGRKHKIFSRREVAVITDGWPRRRTLRS